MAASRFIYVTYIRTTPAKLWKALLEPEFTRKYWSDSTQESQCTVGSPWKLVLSTGEIANSGEVLEIEPERKLVLTWRKEFKPELTAEGHTRLTYDLEQVEDSVKLTITHESDLPNSKMIDAVAKGWPLVLSSLKSLLETGESLESTRQWRPCK